MSSTGKIYFVGAGPGDPELITVKGLNIINKADLIIYAGSLVPAALFKNSSASSIIDSAGLTLEQTHTIMTEGFQAGNTVARVHTGDPSIFGTIQEQTFLLEQQGIPYEIIPGVTAAFAGAAKAGISFTQPETNQTLIITRVSGRTKVPSSQEIKKLAASKSSMAIYLSAGLSGKIRADLLEAGLPPNTLIAIGWKVGWSDEQIIWTDLEKLEQTVSERNITGQAVFLILPATEQARRSRLYHPNFSHGFRSKNHDPA
ncbi:precorrin-4 C(11)-methyltransferase [Desulfonatronovibrio hydrogenovorans]|uniref:precorrin-4 C(11)-methyltransferase n=1 Tax=Desulfonatronovibrio hydrogenovorans TaxID=53245 RepID=UPI00048B1794|nr:precorrin-4 C(11)-methyltransferase [Desulfonatronovibrio hydrogenovorans]